MGHSSLPLPPTQGVIQRGKSAQAMALSEEVLPYGVHHIDPAILAAKRSSADSSFLEFFLNNTQILRKMKNKKTTSVQNRSSDPAMILAFTAKLDDRTKTVIDRQVYVQQLYECRIASLERYVAFCVMFHAMAQHSCAPWLSVPWNISRSQSNLRVATTGKLLCSPLISCVLDSALTLSPHTCTNPLSHHYTQPPRSAHRAGLTRKPAARSWARRARPSACLPAKYTPTSRVRTMLPLLEYVLSLLLLQYVVAIVDAAV